MCDYTNEEIQEMILNINENIKKIAEVLLKHFEMITKLQGFVGGISSYLDDNGHS